MRIVQVSPHFEIKETMSSRLKVLPFSLQSGDFFLSLTLSSWGINVRVLVFLNYKIIRPISLHGKINKEPHGSKFTEGKLNSRAEKSFAQPKAGTWWGRFAERRLGDALII